MAIKVTSKIVVLDNIISSLHRPNTGNLCAQPKTMLCTYRSPYAIAYIMVTYIFFVFYIPHFYGPYIYGL